MTLQIQILSNVIERLKSTNIATTGNLYGLAHNNVLTIITFNISIDGNVFASLPFENFLPSNIEPCGTLFIGTVENNVSHCIKNVNAKKHKVHLRYILNDFKLQWYYIDEALKELNNVKVINENEFRRQFAYVRIQASIPLVTKSEKILVALEKIKSHLLSGKLAIHFPLNDIYLFGKSSNIENMTFKKLLCTTNEHTNDMRKHNEMNVTFAGNAVDVISANLFLQVSGKDSMICTHAPVLHQIKQTFDKIEYIMDADKVSLVSIDITGAELYEILLVSLCQYVDIMKILWETDDKTYQQSIICSKWLYFKPPGLGHLITVPHPKGWNNESMTPCLKQLHKTLGLDLTRPYFRRTNSVRFLTDVRKENEPLINPHEAIISNMDGKLSIIYGFYAYYHYMQDNFDDNGWGCAYRSLQTIVSWYRLQGYTDLPIPSHKTIQQCLVDIGDKSSSFIGSKQWIGSTEVGFVLESLLGISIKILCATSGDEMTTLAYDLAEHFENQGTPVMIGGGVLAHTILGVHYDEASAEVQFLILDPHYTGADKLHTIIHKGWCGWKKQNFWKKDSFYNMCLPQRPICI